MSAQFDVYVVGAVDRSPTAQLRLAATLATTYRVPAPKVAEALAGGHCLIVEGRSEREAASLVKSLETLGALAMVHPHGVPFGARPASTGDPLAVEERRITLKALDSAQHLSVVNVSEAVDFASPGTESRTGVRGPVTTRCPIHGLTYNRQQASGCLRCLETAREQARKITDAGGVPQSPESDGAKGVVRAAFLGLALALIVGFVPAAYYAKVVAVRPVERLRAEQVELSTQAATPATLARFDAIEAEIGRVISRSALRTLVIWLSVGGVAGVAWWAVVRRRLRDAGA